jgi:multiple sugar transport system substrate-binding protein
MKRRRLVLVLAAMACLALAACGSANLAVATGAVSAKLNSCGYPVYTKKVTLTWWTWTANPADTVANFEKCYPSISVQYPLVPAGAAEYAKLTAAMTAGAGAPDVVQIEYQVLPTFIGQHDLVNIASVMDKYKADYPSWVWKEVSSGTAVYAAPEDIGPMGLAYRPSLLSKYGLPVPVTYAQFATDATKLHHDDPGVYMTYFPENDGEYIISLLWQGGASMFQQTGQYSWKVNIDTAANQKVLQYWYNLVKAGAVADSSDYTPAWETQIGDGDFASYMLAAWSPTYEVDEYLKGSNSQQFAVTHMPEWTAGTETDANWGGSSQAVTVQSANPEAAALFVSFINTSKAGLVTDEKPATASGAGRGLFPANVQRASVPEFNAAVPSFVGDVNAQFSKYVPTVNTSFQWSPFSEFLFTELSGEVTAAFSGAMTISAALAATQNAVIEYGNASGYKVSAGT